MDEQAVEEAVTMLVNFVEVNDISTEVALLAMEHIVDKIRGYLKMAAINGPEDEDTVH